MYPADVNYFLVRLASVRSSVGSSLSIPPDDEAAPAEELYSS